jgi:DEAD/DEAH box helicase domain-containing protein
MDTEKLLNEANILNTRINEIYSTSFELKRDLLKQGYYDASLDDIYSRAYKIRKRIELVVSNLNLPIDIDRANQYEEDNSESFNKNYEDSSINIEDIYRIAENLGAEINDVVFYPAKSAKYAPIPFDLYPSIKKRIQSFYPKGLYSHQAKAIELGLAGNSVCVATPTASGKTLIFTSIAISHLLANEGTVVIALYPAKALLHDQERKWKEAIRDTPLKLAIIDGGVETSQRMLLLEQAQIILMTPDVLHAWLMLKLDQKEIQLFLSTLAMIILDEAHIYNGIFGTNMAYLLRRLRAVSGVNQFLASSATIGDPIGFLNQLTGIGFNLIGSDDDGAAVPKKEIMLCRMAISQTTKFLKGLIQEYMTNPHKQGRFLIFVDSRKRVEELAAEQNAHTNTDTNDVDDILENLVKPTILPYRAGYEKDDREKIQQALTDGGLSGVITTSALELGIDIGDIELVIILGEPSSVKSFWQRAGRAGRSKQGLIVLLDLDGRVTAMGLKNYLNRPPEPNWIYLDNEYLQYANVLCAVDEQQKTHFYCKSPFATLPETFLELLDNEIEPTRPISQELYPLKQQVNTKNPHFVFPLRNGIEKSYQVICYQSLPNQQLGTLTYTQLLREAFPGAIYRYLTKPYRVFKIEHPNGKVIADRMKMGIGKTTPTVQIMVFPQFNDSIYFIRKSATAFIAECRVQVSERVTGFTERWGRNQKEVIYEPKNEYAQKPLYNVFYTTAVCFYFSDEQLQATWKNLARYMGLAFCKVCSIQDNDIGWGLFSSQLSPLNTLPIKGFAIYDSVMGSLRLTKQIPSRLDEILTEAIRMSNEENEPLYAAAIEEIAQQIKLFGQAQEDIAITELFAVEKEDDWVTVIAANQLALYHDGQNHINEQVTDLRYVYTPEGIKYFLLNAKYPNANWQVRYKDIRPIPETTKLERYNINTTEIDTI